MEYYHCHYNDYYNDYCYCCCTAIATLVLATGYVHWPVSFLQAFSILSEARDEDARKKGSLLNLFVDAEEILNKMDEKILNLLQQNVGNVEEKMKNHKLQLAQREYFLLVAGKW